MRVSAKVGRFDNQEAGGNYDGSGIIAPNTRQSVQSAIGPKSSLFGSPAEFRVALLTIFSFGMFAGLAFAVSFGAGQEIDRAVLLLFRSVEDTADAIGPVWFEEAAAEITTLGSYTILTIVVGLTAAILFLLRKETAAVFLLSAVVTGSLISTLAKQVFSRARPDLVEHMDRTFTSSFPSAHAMVSAFTWLILAAIAIRFIPRHRVRVFVLIAGISISVLVGVSRVYLGVHWPSDVLAGWFFGAAWAGTCWLAANYLGRQLRRRNDFGCEDATYRGERELETIS